MYSGEPTGLDQTLEDARHRLALVASEIQFAEYGNPGFFDCVQIGEEELEKLHAYDVSVKEHCDAAAAALDRRASRWLPDEASWGENCQMNSCGSSAWA